MRSLIRYVLIVSGFILFLCGNVYMLWDIFLFEGTRFEAMWHFKHAGFDMILGLVLMKIGEAIDNG